MMWLLRLIINLLNPIAVPIVRIEVPEEHDACINLEPKHVGQKASRIEVINEFKQIYVLLIQAVAALVNVFISRKLFHHVAVHHLLGIISGCMMAVLDSHTWSWWWASGLWITKYIIHLHFNS